jgi:hypothetical protein
VDWFAPFSATLIIDLVLGESVQSVFSQLKTEDVMGIVDGEKVGLWHSSMKLSKLITLEGIVSAFSLALTGHYCNTALITFLFTGVCLHRLIS